ncbi:hypothetical protein CHS0354_041508 [Potamilus streckersoni]|uniref:Ninjurin-1 n=1 Tax=Potamilus streckersoni TaxID=2493646 RepID=A0AAE0TB70_9BIVA|nr:hypothetical protein CHS0354_041508 [Potamilus streckersoni]
MMFTSLVSKHLSFIEVAQFQGCRTIWDMMNQDCIKETEENHFNVRRNFVSGLMDMALLLANVSQLRTLLSSNVTDAYYYVKCDLVGFSIFLQMVVAVLLLVIWNIEYSHKDDKGNQTYVTGFASVNGSMIIQSTQNLNSQFTPRSKCSRNTRRYDTFVIGLIMLIIVINVFITGLGIDGKDC